MHGAHAHTNKRTPVTWRAGESRGGVNATPEFFDALERDWECVRVVPVEVGAGAGVWRAGLEGWFMAG